jgi:hypothetical protein
MLTLEAAPQRAKQLRPLAQFHEAALRELIERLVIIPGLGATYWDRGVLCTSVTLGIRVVSID